MTATVICPSSHNCGETVTVDLGGFSATTIKVEPCSVLRAEGVTSYEMRKSAGLSMVAA